MIRKLLHAGLVLAIAFPAAADDAGREEYMVACAVCHGESGKGEGPFAPLLNIHTPDLTRLAADNDVEAGTFPFLEVLMVVDGRTGIRAHGDSAMPIWGERFAATAAETAGPYGSELAVRGRLLSLVYYLESIQE
jgi:mono/diheme cytochrome c family protein